MEGDSGGGKKNRGHVDLGSSSSISFIPTPILVLVLVLVLMLLLMLLLLLLLLLLHLLLLLLMLMLVLVLVLRYQKWLVLGMASLHGEEDFMLGPKCDHFSRLSNTSRSTVSLSPSTLLQT